MVAVMHVTQINGFALFSPTYVIVCCILVAMHTRVVFMTMLTHKHTSRSTMEGVPYIIVRVVIKK